MADSNPLDADPKDVLLAAGAMGAIGVFALVLPGGFEIGAIVLGLAVLMGLVAVIQFNRG